jgi:hypothetical protein
MSLSDSIRASENFGVILRVKFDTGNLVLFLCGVKYSVLRAEKDIVLIS